MVLLYRVSSIVAKADGRITEEEATWLSQLVATTGIDEREEKPEEEATNNPIGELNSLIGLESVKKDVTSLSNFIKMKQMRETKGLKSPNISYHCVFTGNPGTGKTTVARILASIFKELGILKRGHLVETDRSGLVAEYVGQTAVKTNKIIDSALDGVLFIDEAYTLIGGQNDYGMEAIATLLKRMEDDRDRLIVILAGYSKEMEDFINSNPGLRSRFNRYILFPDYTSSELYDIFQLNATKNEYVINEEANQYLKKKLDIVVQNKQKDFGNARYIRNYFELAIEHQANRLAADVNLTPEKLCELTIDDIDINT
jgi:type VII secretion ATPase EccA